MAQALYESLNVAKCNLGEVKRETMLASGLPFTNRMWVDMWVDLGV